MVTIKQLNKDSYSVKFWTEDNFEDLLNLCKSSGMKFDADNKQWIADKFTIYNYLKEFEAIEETKVYPSKDQVLKDCKPIPRIRKQRFKLNDTLFKYPPMKGKPPYENYQYDGIKEACQTTGRYFAFEMGLGKAQPLTSKIMTPSGDRLMGDIRVGDEVLNIHGGTSKVTGVFPQGEIETVTFITNDGCEVVSSLDHLWTIYDTRSKKENKIRTITSQEIMVEIDRLRKQKGYNGGSSRHRLLPIEAFDYGDTTTLPPYFIGAMIGDGCLTKHVTISCHDKDMFIVEECSRELNYSNFEHKMNKLKSKFSYSFTTTRGQVNPIRDELKRLNLYGKKSTEKLIPDNYLYTSAKNRLALLQGLMDTDGYISKEGSVVELALSNEPLIKQARWLVESLGGRGTINRKKAYLNGVRHLDSFRLVFKLPNIYKPFRLPRKVDRIHPKSFGAFRYIKNYRFSGKQECQCISVSAEDNLYLTDHHIPTHNTFLIVNTINQLLHKNKIGSIFILCVPEVLYNWKHEIIKFNSVGLTEDDIYIADKDNRQPFESGKKIVIMTYRTLITISDTYKKADCKKDKKKYSSNYRSVDIRLDDWYKDSTKMLILDEAHKVKSIKTKTYKLLKMQLDHFTYRYLLSGTPAPLGAGDYYSQLQILDETIIPVSYDKWIKTIANIGNRFSQYGLNYYYEDKVDAFLETLKPYMSRLFSKDVLDLPEHLIKENYCELKGKQLKIYQLLIQQELSVIKEEKGVIESKDVYQKFPYLTLALHEPSILQGKIDKDKSPELYKLVEGWKFKDNCKLEVLDGLIDTYIEEGHRILLWSSHPKTIDLLQEHLDKYKPYAVHGQSDTMGLDRSAFKQKMIDDFKKDKESKVFIASSLSLSTGMTLNETTRTIYFDRSYSLENYLQSLKRNHRVGQDNMVIANILMFDNSLETKQHMILGKKEELNNKAFDNKVLSKDDILNVFGGK